MLLLNVVRWHADSLLRGGRRKEDKEDDDATVIELYVVLKCQYKNTKITYPSNFTVGTQVSRGHWYIQESGGTLQRARRSSAGGVT